MANKPFTSQCTNVYNEITYNTVPHAFGLHNVTAMEAHDRTIYDTVKTCIASNFNPHMQMPSNNCSCLYNKSQFVYAQPQITPRGGVTFTFNPVPGPQYNNPQGFSTGNPFQQYSQPCQQALTLQQEIALKQLEHQALELIQIQEQLKKNKYTFQFHHNGQTSTTDLLSGQSQVPLSGGLPDINNALATLESLKKDLASLGIDKLPPDSPPNALYSEVYKAKRLILTKSPDLINKDKPKISCLTEENTECQPIENKSASTSRRNSCNDKKPKKLCKKPKKLKKIPSKGKQKRRHSNPASSNSLVDSDSCSEEEDEYGSDYDDSHDSEESN